VTTTEERLQLLRGEVAQRHLAQFGKDMLIEVTAEARNRARSQLRRGEIRESRFEIGPQALPLGFEVDPLPYLS
jgi:hypothetical protein